jgi:arylamine N-acetyltransferase
MPAAGWGRRFDHLALRVEAGGTGPWLVDVGFGSFSFTRSLICSMLTGDAQVRDAYRVHFGIALDQLPVTRR